MAKASGNTRTNILTDYNIKVVVKANDTIMINKQRKIVANHISASKIIDPSEFDNPEYKEIVKKIKR